MMDLIERFLASSFVLYVTHLLTWGSIAAVMYVFRQQMGRVFDVITDRTAIGATDKSADLMVGAAAGVSVLSLLLVMGANLLFAMGVGVVLYLAMPMVLRRRRFVHYQKDFDGSLVESLSTIASSLRAGLTLKDALIIAAQNCPAVFSGEVSRVLKDYRFGQSIDSALNGVRARVRTQNCNIAFGALVIGTQLGGRIPEILNRIIATIREVDRVEGRLKALTAQGRAQGALLCSMPIVITVGLYFMDREKIVMMMTTPLGQVLIGIAVFLEIVGIAVTWKVMQLEV